MLVKKIIFFLKLIWKELVELTGLFASIKGLNRPSEKSLTSLTLLSLVKLNPTWLLKLVKLVLAYLRGENSCEDKLSLLFEEIKLSSFINTLSSGLPNTSFPRSVSSTTGSVFYLASSCTVLREGVDLCCDILGLAFTTFITWATCFLSTLCLKTMLDTLVLWAMKVFIGVLGDLRS